MDYNYQQLPLEQDDYPDAEQLLPNCSKCFGMEENCEHDGVVVYQWPFEAIDPTLFQPQSSTSHLAGFDFLDQPAGLPQTQFSDPNAEQNADQVPLSLEPGFVFNSIDSTYTVGDRTLSAAPSSSREYSTSTPVSGPSGSQTEDSLRQLVTSEDPSPAPPQGLRRKPTYAEAAALPSPNHLYPQYTPEAAKKKPVTIPFRSRAAPRSIVGPPRPADAQSTTSTHRSGKRKRSPPPVSQSEPSRGMKCQHRGCDKTYNTTSELNHHQKNHREDKDRPYKCNDCGKGFLWNKDLVRHRPKHTRKRDFICRVLVNGNMCGQKYTRNDNLRRHHLNAHPDHPPPSSAGSSQVEP